MTDMSDMPVMPNMYGTSDKPAMTCTPGMPESSVMPVLPGMPLWRSPRPPGQSDRDPVLHGT